MDLFDEHLRRYGGDYKDGLAAFERYVLEGYLYQKLKGRLDGFSEPPDTLPGG